MRDIDSYLLFCALKSMDKGVEKNKIQSICANQMGFSHKSKIKQTNEKSGDK